MDNNPIYERQNSLALYKPSVMIVGCGGVGTWVALALALGGARRLILFDGDSISTNNLNRFPLPPSAIGHMKSVALANWLASLRPDADIQARGELLFDHNGEPINGPPEDVYWMVCATDSLKSRRACHQLSKNIGMNYLEVGAEGERWTLSPAPPEFSTDLEERPGYTSVPIHVGPCMMAGAAAAYYVLHGILPQATHSGTWNLDGGLGLLEFRTIDESPIPIPDIPVDPDISEDETGIEIEEQVNEQEV